jgi:hypothetical protein
VAVVGRPRETPAEPGENHEGSKDEEQAAEEAGAVVVVVNRPPVEVDPPPREEIHLPMRRSPRVG